jgi:hypothetical protein
MSIERIRLSASTPVARRRGAANRCRLGPVEFLEDRTLLADLVWPRILNGREVDDAAPSGRATPRIVNGEPTTAFQSVGIVGDRFEGFCTGTLVNTRFVLTAGHCIDDLADTQARFTVAGDVYASDRLFVHPSYRLNRLGTDRANDIAIMELSSEVTDVTPSPIYRDTPEVGQVLTLVGFGAGGTGDTGQNGDFGTKRFGTTPIDQVTATLIRWEFDDNSESNTAPGDSGGPAFLLVDDIYYVAGVTSGGDRADAAIGDDSFDTRVDAYADWIESIAGPLPPPAVDPNPNPEPNPDPGDPTPDDHPDEPGPGATPLQIHAGGRFAATGFLEQAGDRDVFQIELAAASRVLIELKGVGRTLDTYLRVFDSTTALINENDDFAAEVSSRLGLSLGPGVYFISVGSFGDAEQGEYDLEGKIATDDHGDTQADATVLDAVGAGVVTAAGTIDHVGDKDYFRFAAARSGPATITLAAPGGLFDRVLTLFDGRGRRIGFNDDSENGTDSSLNMRLRRGQTYFIEAAGYRSATGAYQLTIARTAKQRPRGVTVVRVEPAPGASPPAPQVIPVAAFAEADSVWSISGSESPNDHVAKHAAAVDSVLAINAGGEQLEVHSLLPR